MAPPTTNPPLLLDLIERLKQCNADELEVVAFEIGRIEVGRRDYGYLDLSKARDWDTEEAEELFDARFYRTCARIVNERRIANIVETTKHR